MILNTAKIQRIQRERKEVLATFGTGNRSRYFKERCKVGSCSTDRETKKPGKIVTVPVTAELSELYTKRASKKQLQNRQQRTYERATKVTPKTVCPTINVLA